ncbi:hypothetical protein BDD12DRAFT_844007 [Trichophaea hybrida]|nr:hypothetical protein BDD12DRAFT_844007 [Trichophaea hybrida]
MSLEQPAFAMLTSANSYTKRNSQHHWLGNSPPSPRPTYHALAYDDQRANDNGGNGTLRA